MPTIKRPDDSMGLGLARQKYIGATDIGRILGLDEYKTPYEVFLEKTGQAQPDEMTEDMEMGILFEDLVAKRFEKAHPQYKSRRVSVTHIHESVPYFGANLDRTIRDTVNPNRGTGVLELKTASQWVEKTWEKEIPLQYYCQCQWQMYVTGHKWGAIAVLIGGRKLKVLFFDYDDAFIQKMLPTIHRFWNEHVSQGKPPEWTTQDLEMLTPREGSQIDISNDLVPVFSELREVKQKIAALKKKEEELASPIKLFMADNEVLTMDGDVIATWRKSEDKIIFNEEAFAEQQPKLYTEFLNKKKPGSRRFVLKKESE